ncbi:serine/threonine-protein kinase [Streptomyces sp. NPDC001108]
MHSQGTTGEGRGDGPGTVIAGRYRLLRRLGHGGMGVVWEALDTSLDRKVAVKGLLTPGAATPGAQTQWVSRPRREAQAIARIGHQNVVAVHDVIEDGQQVWIVMELLNSRSLADLLREQQQLSVPHAARIGLQVLRGLAAVHEAGVLHRDVKPHNILFRSDGRALLMDFGISTFEGAVQVTRSHEIIGTVQYLAPELLSRSAEQPHPATPASDLWALGITLYEMVEGRRPFDGHGSIEILIAVRESPMPPPRFAGPLTALITALLQKDPRQRPDAARAEAMLQEVTRDFPSLDTPDGRQPPAPAPAPALQEPGTGANAVPLPGAATGRKGWDRWKVPVSVLCTALLLGGVWFVRAQLSDSGEKNDAVSEKDGKPERYRDTHSVLKVGVKADQPALSKKEGGEYKGFEPALARLIGTLMGYDRDEIEFVRVTSDNRAKLTRDSDRVDITLATYSGGPERAAADGVAFVGPYFKPLGGLLVRDKAHRKIKGLRDLQTNDPDVEVCTANGSTYMKYIEEKGLIAEKRFPPSYEECVQELLSDSTKVYAVVTDDAIVAGYADENEATRKLPDEFDGGATGYGIAMKPGEDLLQKEVRDALWKILERDGAKESKWEGLYKEYLQPVFPGSSTPNTPKLGEWG